MGVTATPALVQLPKAFTASIGNGDASSWKLLKDNAGLGAGSNGTKIVEVNATSDDSSARVVQLARARSATVTMTLASPCVVSWSAANGNDLAVGDQVMFTSSGALPTGITAGETYWVISAGFTQGVSFEIAASAGGSAINTSGSQSGTQTIYRMGIIGSQTVAITAGTDGVTAAADLLGETLIPALPVDNDGQQYTFLESEDYLAVSATTTVTANKIINVEAVGGNF